MPACGRATNNGATRATERDSAEMVDAQHRPRSEAKGLTALDALLGGADNNDRKPRGD